MRSLFVIASLCFSVSLSARSITVDKNGSIKSLKAAVSMAIDGDTIFLNAGTYREGNIIISKSICLIGRNPF